MAINGQDIQYGPWTGGVWYSKPEEDVREDELSSMENVRIQAAGACEKRPGTVSYKSADNIATDPTVTMLAEFVVPPSTTYVVMVCDTVFYLYSGGWSDITNGLTITAGDDNTFEWAVDEGTGVLMMTNNVDVPIKYGGPNKDFGGGAGIPAVVDVDSRFTTAEHVAHWDNRAWWGNVDTNYDRLWYTDIGDIDTVGATSFYQFGHPITALVTTRNALTVHTTGGIFTMIPTGNSQIPYQQQQRTSRAAINGRANVVLPGDIQLILRKDGIYQWDGGDDLEKKSFALDLGYWPELVTDRLSQAFAVYYPLEAEAWFWLPYGTSQTEMNHIMVYSQRHDCWFGPYTGSTSHFFRNCAALVDQKPHAGTLSTSGDIGGKIEDHAPVNVYNDDDDTAGGTAIRSYFRTGAPAPSGSAQRIRWLHTRTYYDSTGNYDVTVTQESSGVSGTTETVNMAGGGFLLDTDKTDEGELGTVRMLAQDTDLSEYDPHSSLKYTNNSIDQLFRIRRCHPVFKVLGRKRRVTAGVS
jgi:hypothetical protein|tara:strand:+ start:8347 stop:9918 length:1572 start_codon:yes stop_codon:yes gene_type:complete